MKVSRCFFSLLLVAGFTLGVFRGYVALWKDGSEEPSQIYPCPVSALPEEDQQTLTRGIHARSRQELDLMLEDYLS